MSIDIHLSDGETRQTVNISPQGAMTTHLIDGPIPESGRPNRARIFNAICGTTGANSGTTNANVDGSSSPVRFYVGSHADYDIHVMGIIILIADTAIVHSKYGNINALTNGVDLLTRESGEDTYIAQGMKTGGQFLVTTGLYHPYGEGATVNELSNWTGTEDAQTISIDMRLYIRDGLRIGRGNTDKLIFCVNDDLTGLTEHTCRAIGFRLYP